MRVFILKKKMIRALLITIVLLSAFCPHQVSSFPYRGVVFSGPHPRITLIDGFVCEFEAEGTILATTNQDRPGMVGVLGTCLGKNSVNIDQFQLSRNTPGGAALSLIRVDDDLLDSVLEEIRNMEGITSVCKIIL